MRIRGANKADFRFIDGLYQANSFNFDAKQLEQIIIAEDDNGIVAVGTLVKHLEVGFVTVPTRSRKARVIALTALIEQVNTEAKILGYDHVHAFATNESILHILKDKFEFVKTKAIQVLVRFVKKET